MWLPSAPERAASRVAVGEATTPGLRVRPGEDGSDQAGEPDPSAMVAVWLCPLPSTHSTRTLSSGEYFTSSWVSCWADVIVVPASPVMVSPDWMPASSAPEPDCTWVTCAPLPLPWPPLPPPAP